MQEINTKQYKYLSIFVLKIQSSSSSCVKTKKLIDGLTTKNVFSVWDALFGS